MTTLSDYVDVRDIHPDYTTIPCMGCGTDIHVTLSFAYTTDEWYCRSCKPDKLKNVGGPSTRTVRL